MTRRRSKASIEKEILSYLTEVRTSLRMDGWNILVTIGANETMDEDALAEVIPHRFHDSMEIWIADDFHHATPAVKRNTLVHELIHALHRDTSYLWLDCIEDNDAVSANEARSWTGDWHVHMERLVSRVARLVAPTVPEWPGSGGPAGSGVTLTEDHEG